MDAKDLSSCVAKRGRSLAQKPTNGSMICESELGQSCSGLVLLHSLEGGRNGETARCGETEARTFTSKNPKAWLTGPHSMHIRKKNNVERTNGTHSYGWSATVGILIAYSVLLIVPHLYFTTLVPDAYVALASGFQIAMLGLAGSVLILIASISRSDTMRLRTLLRGCDVQ